MPLSVNIKQTPPFWLLLSWCFGLLGLLLFVQPSAAWRDGPEFIVSAWVLGIAHPAGFPLYQSLAWFAEQMPFADISLRNHLFSLFCTFLAMFSLYVCALSFMRLLPKQEQQGLAHRHVAGMISLCWLMMPASFENAIQSEVYALMAIFYFLVMSLLFGFWRTQETRYYVLACFLAGVGCSNHVMLGALLFALMFALSVVKTWRSLWEKAVAGLVAGLAGLSLYAYLPVRSWQNPSYDWGNPETWQRFWHHVLDKKDSASHFATAIDQASQPAMNHLQAMIDWFSMPGLFLLLAAWLLLLRTRARLFVLCLLPVLFLFQFFLGWFSGTVLTGALGLLIFGFIPWLLAAFVAWKQSLRQRLLAMLAFVGIAFSFLHVYQAGLAFLLQRSDYLPKEAVAIEFLQLPYRATVFASLNWFHLRSLQDIESMRPDVTVIGLGDILSPQHFNPLRPAMMPLLHYPDALAVPYQGRMEDDSIRLFITDLLVENQQRTVFYVELNDDYASVFEDMVQPDKGLWARLEEAKHFDCAILQTALGRSLTHGLQEQGAVSDAESHRFYQDQYMAWVNQIGRQRSLCLGLNVQLLRWWLTWMGHEGLSPGFVANSMGVALARQGYTQSAKTLFIQADQAGLPEGSRNLGVWYEQHAQPDQAARFYHQSFLRGFDRAYLDYQRLLHRNAP